MTTARLRLVDPEALEIEPFGQHPQARKITSEIGRAGGSAKAGPGAARTCRRDDARCPVIAIH